jgi:hypothetical protein
LRIQNEVDAAHFSKFINGQWRDAGVSCHFGEGQKVQTLGAAIAAEHGTVPMSDNQHAFSFNRDFGSGSHAVLSV